MVDVRLFYSTAPIESWKECRFSSATAPDGYAFYATSPVSTIDICWTTEALKYAQTAFLVSVITMQIATAFCVKNRSSSISESLMNNWALNFTILWQIILVSCLVYIPFCNYVF